MIPNYLLTPWGLLGILLIHYLADFIAQPDSLARNKWHSNTDLCLHTFLYSIIWWTAMLLYGTINVSNIVPLPFLYVVAKPIEFFIITFLAHTITDYITSRETHKYFEKKDTHNGFIIIGLDQILHYVQIYLTIKLLYS